MRVASEIIQRHFAMVFNTYLGLWLNFESFIQTYLLNLMKKTLSIIIHEKHFEG